MVTRFPCGTDEHDRRTVFFLKKSTEQLFLIKAGTGGLLRFPGAGLGATSAA
jgi:hypothetical protein